jgi:hypothetical protein
MYDTRLYANRWAKGFLCSLILARGAGEAIIKKWLLVSRISHCVGTTKSNTNKGSFLGVEFIRLGCWSAVHHQEEPTFRSTLLSRTRSRQGSFDCDMQLGCFSGHHMHREVPDGTLV